MMRKILTILPPTLAALLAACSSENGDAPARAQSAPRVEVVVASHAKFDTSRQWPATMEALRSYEIMAPENGRIVAFDIDAGSEIRAGEVIVKMRFPDADARKDSLTRRLELLQLERERLQNLATERAVSDAVVRAAEIELLAAQAELRGIEAVLGEGELKAPADGWVLETHAVVGSSVVEEVILARVADASSIGVRLSVPNTELRYFEDLGHLTAETSGGDAYGIDRIVQRGSAGTNAASLEVWLDPETARRTGAVKIRYHSTREAIAVPWSAVATDDDRTWLAVVDEDNRIQRREITPGATTGTMLEVVAGLEPGERVVRYQPRSHGDEALVEPVERGTSERNGE